MHIAWNYVTIKGLNQHTEYRVNMSTNKALESIKIDDADSLEQVIALNSELRATDTLEELFTVASALKSKRCNTLLLDMLTPERSLNNILEHAIKANNKDNIQLYFAIKATHIEHSPLLPFSILTFREFNESHSKGLNTFIRLLPSETVDSIISGSKDAYLNISNIKFCLPSDEMRNGYCDFLIMLYKHHKPAFFNAPLEIKVSLIVALSRNEGTSDTMIEATKLLSFEKHIGINNYVNLSFTNLQKTPENTFKVLMALCVKRSIFHHQGKTSIAFASALVEAIPALEKDTFSRLVFSYLSNKESVASLFGAKYLDNYIKHVSPNIDKRTTVRFEDFLIKCIEHEDARIFGLVDYLKSQGKLSDKPYLDIILSPRDHSSEVTRFEMSVLNMMIGNHCIPARTLCHLVQCAPIQLLTQNSDDPIENIILSLDSNNHRSIAYAYLTVLPIETVTHSKHCTQQVIDYFIENHESPMELLVSLPDKWRSYLLKQIEQSV